MKLCLFGGTFDPPHVGHLVIAETIQESERFDKVVFVPASNPPHKAEDISPIESRLEMLRLALVDNDHFDVSDIEIERGGISYAVETIEEAKEGFGIGAEKLYFLIGSDSLLDFHNWKHYEAILNECRVATQVPMAEARVFFCTPLVRDLTPSKTAGICIFHVQAVPRQKEQQQLRPKATPTPSSLAMAQVTITM